MNRKVICAFIIMTIMAIVVGCSGKPETVSEHKTASHGHHQYKHQHKHAAAHGGSLNAIVACENGHAEVKLEGDTLQLWFVGGGTDTTKSVRVPDKSITIQVTTADGAKTLVLKPKPLDLAGEKIGDCSYFEGNAPWLGGLKTFSANGQITFRGKKMPLKIEYPNGYDPD
ncbi:hypothetical protein LLG46_15325 [bacterium]|nr:hypothetical protein [bacterium]